MVTHTGEREIRAVFARLPDNSGELACMALCNFLECIPLGISDQWSFDLNHVVSKE